jgi:thiosulfate dehydrogenase (quinone) large subunit
MDNPASDVFAFLTKPAWYTGVFWLLMIGSVAIALYCLTAIPEQRQPKHVANWLFRFFIGALWWQQTLWKLPPDYTDQPGRPFGATGLAHWMQTLGKSAAIPLQADFVNHIVLPNFYLFAPVVYGLEVLTGVSLILGGFVRLFGVIGALQILNLWLGLYNAWGEWPWTYFFLLVLQLVFALHQYGRSLGIDAILAARPRPHWLLDWVS